MTAPCVISCPAAYTGLESAKVVTTAAGRLLLGGPRRQTDATVQLEALPRQQALQGGSAAGTDAPEDEAASEVCGCATW